MERALVLFIMPLTDATLNKSLDKAEAIRYLTRMAIQPLFRVIGRVKNRITPRVLNKTSNYTVTADDLSFGGALLSNSGATGAVVFALPAAVPGMRLFAAVNANFNLTLDLPTGDVIAGLATSGQTFSADLIGESLHLTCAVAGIWTRVALNGTWTAA